MSHQENQSTQSTSAKFPFIMNYFGVTNSLSEETKNGKKLIKDILVIVKEILFDVWSEDNDPALQYYPSIPSYSDYDLLMQFVRRKKIFGLFLILNLLNIGNLIIPDYNCDDLDLNQQNDGSNQIGFGFSPSYSRCLVNLVCEAVIFCFSFYICFCSQIVCITQENLKLTLTIAIGCQYIVFLVNNTIMFTLIIKETIKDKRLLCILLLNTFVVNYLGMQGLQFYKKDSQKNLSTIDVFKEIIGYGEYSRAHIFALIGVVLQVVQIQYLNQSLIRMLVGKINRLKESLDIKDTYNASMIHELRNPLNAILGSIGLLKYSKSLSKEDLETLNIASVSGEILITLINNALDGAKLEANRLELDSHMTDIIEILTKAVSLFQWKSREKKINIQLKIGKNIPKAVEIDDARVTQMLVNIIGNAVKFTPTNGQVKVRARFINEEGKQNHNSAFRIKSSLRKSDLDDCLVEDNEDEDEYERKFFYNKELFNDIQASDEQIDHHHQHRKDSNKLLKQITRNKLQSLESANFADDQAFVNQYDLGSMSDFDLQPDDNSIEPVKTVTVQTINNQPNCFASSTRSPLSFDGQLAFFTQQDKPEFATTVIQQKKEFHTMTSFQVTQDINFKNYFTQKSRRSIVDRDLMFKNSFHEWSPANQLSKRFLAYSTNPIESERQVETQPINDMKQGQYKKKDIDNFTQMSKQTINSMKQSLAGINQTKQIVEDIKKKTLLGMTYHPSTQPHQRLIDRNAETLSESLNRNKSLSIESAFMKEQANSKQTYTNSSNSNNLILQKAREPEVKQFEKSKFYNRYERLNQESDFNNNSDLQIQEEQEDGIRKENNKNLESESSSKSNNNINTKSEQYQGNKVNSSETLKQKNHSNEIKGRLIIEVIDSGIGMSQEGIKKLYQPFSQADKSIQAKYGGTGLGLWITNKLVSLMRGTISVHSELNKGTNFTIDIPVNGENSFNDQKENDLLHETSISSLHDERYQVNQKLPVSHFNHNSLGHQNLSIIQNSQLISNEQDDIKMLLYQHDEMMKNLFKKYLQKHNIQNKFASSFKELLRTFKVKIRIQFIQLKQFQACFMDIDVNVKNDDLEELVNLCQKYRNEPQPYKCKIYCLYSRDIDKTKTRFLQRNHIQCFKKPIQGYQLSKILKKIKSQQSQEVPNLTIAQNKSSIQQAKHQEIMMDNFKHRPPTQQLIYLSSITQNYPNQQQQPAINNSGMNKANNNISNGKKQRSKSQFAPLKNDENSNRRNPYQDYNQLSEQGSILIDDADKSQITNQFQQQDWLNDDRSDNSDIIIFTKQGRQKTGQKKLSDEIIINNNIIQPIKNMNSNRQIDRVTQKVTLKQMSNKYGEAEERQLTNLITDSERHIDASFQQQPANQKSKNQFQNDASSFFQNIDKESKQFWNEEQKTHYRDTITPEFGTSDIICDSSKASHQILNYKLENLAAKNSSTNQESNSQKQSKYSRSGTFTISNSPKNEENAILIVDDNKMNQFILEKLLEKVQLVKDFKIELIVADNGEEALNVFTNQSNAQKIKLILMDCEMPVMDGYEASRKIREYEQNLSEDLSRVMIIGLSGNEGDLHSRKCKTHGMNDTVTKPIILDMLKTLVKKAFSKTKGSSKNAIPAGLTGFSSNR